MPYTHCTACGAKALVGATRCPRCQAPFVSYDPNGDRVETVNCPKCGVQRPVAIGVCPNCLTSTAPSGWRLTRGLILSALAIGVIVAVGYMISRRTEHATAAAKAGVNLVIGDTMSNDSLVAADSAVARDTIRVKSADTTSHPPSVTALPVPAASNASTAPITTVPRPAPLPSVAVPDTGLWEYAVAKTWVRVRSAPAITGEVLRMVDSAQRVRLGPPVNGWRPVRVGVDRGWVDPRLFAVTPAAKP